MSVRLAALLVAFVAVLAAMGRLREPRTHEAIGRVLGAPAAASGPVGPPLVEPGVYAAIRDNAPFRSAEGDAWRATVEAASTAPTGSPTAVGYSELVLQPERYRGMAVRVAGTVRRVEALAGADDAASGDDDDRRPMWRLTLQPAGGGVWPLTVYTLHEPPPGAPPWEAYADGVFFKKLSYRWAEGVGVTPVVVARVVKRGAPPAVEAAPTPATDSDEEAIDLATSGRGDGSMGRTLLAELGVDLAALDAAQDRTPLVAEESDVFYAVLSAVGKTPASQLARLAEAGLSSYARRARDAVRPGPQADAAARAIDLAEREGRHSAVPLFLASDALRGELVSMDAVVRRVVRVDAAGSSDAQREGVTHYYELEAYPDDSQNLPVVFCMRNLPPGFPTGDRVRQPARLAGFLFKQWAYRSSRPSGRGDGLGERRVAPLLIGRAPIPLATPQSRPGRVSSLVGLVVAGAFAAVALAAWRSAAGDRRYEAATLARLRKPSDADEDFDRLGSLAEPAQTGPPLAP